MNAGKGCLPGKEGEGHQKGGMKKMEEKKRWAARQSLCSVK